MTKCTTELGKPVEFAMMPCLLLLLLVKPVAFFTSWKLDDRLIDDGPDDITRHTMDRLILRFVQPWNHSQCAII